LVTRALDAIALGRIPDDTLQVRAERGEGAKLPVGCANDEDRVIVHENGLRGARRKVRDLPDARRSRWRARGRVNEACERVHDGDGERRGAPADGDAEKVASGSGFLHV